MHNDAAIDLAYRAGLQVNAVLLAAFSLESAGTNRDGLDSVVCRGLIVAKGKLKVFFHHITSLIDACGVISSTHLVTVDCVGRKRVHNASLQLML